MQPRISIMYGIGRTSFFFRRQLHTSRCDAPSEMLREKAANIEKMRKRRDRKKNHVFVVVPRSAKFYDTATMPMYLVAIGTVIFVKLLMMYDETTEEERLEEKIKNAPEGQGSVRMVTREEWDEMQERWPRTPFESRIARPNARVRTGEYLHMDDYKDWTIDVLTDALTRAEEAVRNGSQ